jgi:uracil-DNA glycosylase
MSAVCLVPVLGSWSHIVLMIIAERLQETNSEIMVCAMVILGERRIHKKPSPREMAACRPWLEAPA